MGLRKYNSIVYWVTMIWLLSACNSQTRYHQFRSIDKEEWRQTDTLSFDVPLNDTFLNHTLKLQLRHTARFPYKNLSIGMQVFSPDSQFTKTDKFNIHLMNDEGFWVGGGQGGLYQMNMGEMRLPLTISGTWHIHLFHAMDDSILVGIHDVGIEISALPASPASIYSQENKQ